MVEATLLSASFSLLYNQTSTLLSLEPRLFFEFILFSSLVQPVQWSIGIPVVFLDIRATFFIVLIFNSNLSELVWFSLVYAHQFTPPHCLIVMKALRSQPTVKIGNVPCGLSGAVYISRRIDRRHEWLQVMVARYQSLFFFQVKCHRDHSNWTTWSEMNRFALYGIRWYWLSQNLNLDERKSWFGRTDEIALWFRGLRTLSAHADYG